MTSLTCTTTTTTRHTATIDELEIDLPCEPDEYMDAFITDDVIRYAVVDQYPFDFDWSEGVQFEEFTTEWDRDEWLEARRAEGMTAFIVGKFDHSGVSYCLHGEREYPDMRWDYAPSCAIAICDDFTDPHSAAESWVKEYDAWVQGEVYSVVEMRRHTGEGSGSWDSDWDHEILGGFIGTEYAQQTVNEGF